jgi:hypothetical protein
LHQLGIVLAILGMVPTFVPPCFQPPNSSLRLLGRVRIALATSFRSSNLATPLLGASLLPPTEAAPDQEADQESNSTENLAETFAWSEALTVRRPLQRAAALGSFAPPGQAADHRRSTLQRGRSLPILAAFSASLTARLCRFTC